MVVYRIDRLKRASQVLSGIGAQINGGRWNTPGFRAVYCAGSRSLVILEMLVHLELYRHFPSDRIIAAIEIPDELIHDDLDANAFNGDWRSFPFPANTQKIFGDFVRRNLAAVLAVPSAVVPQEHNYVVNPLHPDYRRIRVLEVEALKLDFRLMGGNVS